ncbi:uncharacterized protein LOC126122157 [Schistocerca cancellata]|uniref:uncharacterized protein LOC126122157 n=1 Tax=Schistocerca cancellata TaxID=274614 RepID=UPI002117C7F9|nr:uncharacterized protein LOC126122157 [Schistocerca cancellata]
MHKSKSGASAQAAYTPQVYWFQMLKFLDQSTEADDSLCNLESPESETGSERATPTYEEMSAHAVQEPVACSEAQPQPLRQERPPTKRRRATPDVATNVMVEATKTLQAVADAARSMPVQEDRYGTLGAHIAAELREMEKVGGREYTTVTAHSLQRTLMDRRGAPARGSRSAQSRPPALCLAAGRGRECRHERDGRLCGVTRAFVARPT